MRVLSLILIIAMLTACRQSATPLPPPAVPSTDSPRRAQMVAGNALLSRGQQQYNLRCAHCHGYDGEGQLPVTITNTQSLGMLTIPAHNASGHTWMHPDQLLVRVIKEGISNPLDQFPMEPYASVMSDDDINAVIAYIKLWWTDEQQAQQLLLSKHWADLDRQLGAGSS